MFTKARDQRQRQAGVTHRSAEGNITCDHDTEPALAQVSQKCALKLQISRGSGGRAGWLVTERLLVNG